MKMLVRRICIDERDPFNFQEVMRHVRVDDTTEELAVIRAARAAAYEIEQFAQIALLTQAIRVTIFNPAQGYGLSLPIGPATDDDMPTVTIDGAAVTAFDFVGGNRPYIRWLSSYHDVTPRRMIIEYEAGFGTDASSIPHDLAQALMDQAALHYEARSPMDTKSLTTSPHMVRIGARYRGVQV